MYVQRWPDALAAPFLWLLVQVSRTAPCAFASGTSRPESSSQPSRPITAVDSEKRPQPERYASPRSTVTISAMTATCPLSSGEKTIGSYSGLIGDSTIRAWRQSSSSEAAFSDE